MGLKGKCAAKSHVRNKLRFWIKEQIAKLEHLKGQSEQKGQKFKNIFRPNQRSDKKWGVEAAADNDII